MDLCERIDQAREHWNVLRHPFYTRWERGDLTRDELAFYAGEYRHAVVALAEAAAATRDAEHAREEAEHVELWDAFAEALHAPLEREPTAETSACSHAWARTDPLEALAVLYAVESAQPAIAETKLRGLVEHYGFGPDDAGTEYFEGRRHSFDLELDLAGVGPFPRRVLEELAHVPYGEVTTYGRLAAQVERPRAARAVGTVMNRNPIPIVLPCHRVVGSTGKLVGYGGGLERKERLLRLEGALL